MGGANQAQRDVARIDQQMVQLVRGIAGAVITALEHLGRLSY